MDAKPHKPRRLEVAVPVSSFLCPPAVRTVVLHVDVCRSEYMREIVPVLAVETVILDVYSRAANDDQELPLLWASPEALLAGGYTHVKRENELRMVTIEDGSYLDANVDWYRDDGITKIVVCMWPPAQDEERFDSIFKEMEKSLADRKSKK